MSHIGFGMHLISHTAQGTALVTTKVAASRWGVFELSARDLMILADAKEDFPELPSARLIAVTRTKRECELYRNHRK